MGPRGYLRQHDMLLTNELGQSCGLVTAPARVSRNRIAESSVSLFASSQPGNRAAIAAQIRAFHTRACTLTDDVSASLDRLQAGAPIVRITHQPNTLVSLNIVNLCVVAKRIARTMTTSLRTEPVVVFSLVDYDVAGDTRFRAPRLPATDLTSVMTLPGAISKRSHQMVAALVPCPGDQVVDGWSGSIWTHSIGLSRRIGLDHALTKGEFEELLAPYRIGLHLAEANSRHLSTVVNRACGLDVLFLRAGSLLLEQPNLMHKRATQLSQESEALHRVLDSRLSRIPKPAGVVFDSRRLWPLWIICPHCLRRSVVENAIDLETVLVTIECSHCGRTVSASFDSRVGTEPNMLPGILPTVWMCDHLDIDLYDSRIGVHYAGGVIHLLRSRSVTDIVSGGSVIEVCCEGKDLVPATVAAAFRAQDGTAPGCQHILEGRCPMLWYMMLFERTALMCLEFEDD